MARKPYENDDPMELVGVSLPNGDADVMAECFVEEFVWLGLDNKQILNLFRNSFYAGAHGIYRRHGETYVRDIISRVQNRFGKAASGGNDA